MLFGDEHVQVYEETGGAEGHIWLKDAPCLILATTGRKSGKEYKSPLIYQQHEGGYVIVASKGGADDHPAWYKNLVAEPEVGVQVGPDTFTARARTAGGRERSELWSKMAQVWPDYDNYQTKTDREIPVVVLEPVA
ncbi:MAG: nitroreductase family deazaflavin-dependent oxidoreductase [Thermocrispum sp.]